MDLGALAGAAISTIGNLFGGSSASKATEAANRANIAMQMAFAKNAIQWKTEDAKKAGIHPIYALGAPTMSPSVAIQADTGMADAMSRSGQDIGRAVEATMNAPDRLYAKTAQALTLKRMGLENDILAQKLAAGNQPGIPPFPGGARYVPGLEGQGQAQVLKDPSGSPVTPINVGGMTVVPNKGFSDVEHAQRRYGEPAEWALFAPTVAADVVSTLEHYGIRPPASLLDSPNKEGKAWREWIISQLKKLF